MSSLSHHRARELLQASLDADLVSFERAVLDHHLNNCEACQQFALELNQFEHRLSEGLLLVCEAIGSSGSLDCLLKESLILREH